MKSLSISTEGITAVWDFVGVRGFPRDSGEMEIDGDEKLEDLNITICKWNEAEVIYSASLAIYLHSKECHE